MHNPHPSSTPPLPPPPPPALDMDAIDDSSASIWDWSQFLDFNIDDHLPLPTEEPEHSPVIPTFQERDSNPIDNPQPEPDYFPVNLTSNGNDRVRKRDPRMACSNFLAGRIPCACPELDAQLAAEEEEAAPGKKRSRTITARAVASARCQVPGCEVDISELKGYHRRHRVCLPCANASTVVLDGHSKRYCQQCGKFHVLSDFDEGKRSCRRKLERHNNRRRRKPSDSKGSGLQSAEYDDSYDEAGKGGKCTSSEAAGEKLLLAAEGHNNIPCSTQAQNIHSDSIISLAASGETQTDEEKEKGTRSPSYCDDKSAFSSVCPTGRISFKLYDWNPAEFPRRLRHQIFQWLASMPVELEGYIRPGCTILTIFIAMPRFMWVKLDEDPVVCIHDLLASPRNMLSGRDTFFVNLNSMIFSVMKGGISVIKVNTREEAPKLHYVQPTCFVAGKPIEFLACGSNLLRPRLRFLVSFAGKYMTNVCVSPLSNKIEASTTNFDHQFLNIRIPRTELEVFGPGFIEVENESGLSNFIPILVADEEVCSEIKIMQMKYYSTLYSKDSNTSISCEVAVFRQNEFSEILLDMAWLLKQPVLEEMEYGSIASQLQRFTCVINFLTKYDSTTVLKRVLRSVNTRIAKSGGIVEAADRKLLQGTVDHATEVLRRRLEKKANDQPPPFVPTINQPPHTGGCTGGNSLCATSGDKSENVPLLSADCIMSVRLCKDQPEKPSNRIFSYNANRFLTFRSLVLAIALVAVCFGICAIAYNPQKATSITMTIRRCLFD